jgi:hypothetical protein
MTAVTWIRAAEQGSHDLLVFAVLHGRSGAAVASCSKKDSLCKGLAGLAALVVGKSVEVMEVVYYIFLPVEKGISNFLRPGQMALEVLEVALAPVTKALGVGKAHASPVSIAAIL